MHYMLYLCIAYIGQLYNHLWIIISDTVDNVDYKDIGQLWFSNSLFFVL